ncbi:hypothetical protein TNCV_1595621 [Trichonephila clavipes]|nr:hypothetical protein TNCV_1595621 [Trichonephila clavipes]
MKTLEMISKMSGENLPWLDPKFTNGIGVLKKAENPSNTKNALDDLHLNLNAENIKLILEYVQTYRCQTREQIAEAAYFLKTSFEEINSS